MSSLSPKIALLFEHPEWFKPLFAELDRRGVRYDQLLACAARDGAGIESHATWG